MGIFTRLFDFLFAPEGTYSEKSGLYTASNDSLYEDSASKTVINPSTGLPMLTGIGGLDVGGHPYGITYGHHDQLASANDANLFNHDCGSVFDHSASSFDCGSSFDSYSSSDFGAKFD